MDAAEYERRHQKLHALAEFFRARPREWVDARELEDVAGRCAWRTRCSELRTKLGMTIENHQLRVTKKDAKGQKMRANGFIVISRYRFLPFKPLGRDASQPMPTYQPELFIR